MNPYAFTFFRDEFRGALFNMGDWIHQCLIHYRHLAGLLISFGSKSEVSYIVVQPLCRHRLCAFFDMNFDFAFIDFRTLDTRGILVLRHFLYPASMYLMISGN